MAFRNHEFSLQLKKEAAHIYIHTLFVLLAIVLSSEDLRCDVVGRTAEGARGVAWSDSLLRGGGAEEH